MASESSDQNVFYFFLFFNENNKEYSFKFFFLNQHKILSGSVAPYLNVVTVTTASDMKIIEKCLFLDRLFTKAFYQPGLELV